MKFVLFCIVALFSFASFQSLSQKTITVVIDPGHGGHDPGHLPNDKGIATEAEINLKISKFLGGYIEKYLQNVKVIYTRTTDVYPSLDDRVSKANNIHADYFISIHCNGNERKNVRGTEVHVHSLELNKSLKFAQNVDHQFKNRAGRKSRGVKDKRDLRHSIQVLKYTNMPSVLVECGFLTNSKEARYLNSTHGQEIIASAIFRGFRTTLQQAHPNMNFVKTQPAAKTEPTNTTDSKTVKYGIQIMSSKIIIGLKEGNFSKLNLPVQMKELNTTSAYKYIYYVGSFETKAEAKKKLPDIQKAGFKDAIVISIN